MRAIGLVAPFGYPACSVSVGPCGGVHDASSSEVDDEVDVGRVRHVHVVSLCGVDAARESSMPRGGSSVKGFDAFCVSIVVQCSGNISGLMVGVGG